MSQRLTLSTLIIITIVSSLFWGFTQRPEGLIDDANEYASIAQHIHDDGSFALWDDVRTMKRELVYPVFLSGLLAFGAPLIESAAVAQLVLLVVLVIVVYQFFQKTHPKHAFISAFLIAVAPPLAYFTGQVLAETLFTVLLISSLLLLIYGIKRTRRRFIIFSGVLLGLAILTRSVLLLFPPFLVILALIFWRKHLSAIILFSFIAILTVLPWSIRNHALFDTYSPTSGGSHLLVVRAMRTDFTDQELRDFLYYTTIGSATTTQAQESGTYAHELFRFAHARELTHILLKGGLTIGEVDAWQMQYARMQLLEKPLTYLALNPVEVIKLNAPPIHTFTSRTSTNLPTQFLIAILYLGLYSASLAACIRIWRAKQHPDRPLVFLFCAMILYNNAFLMFFDAIPRYNVPLLPLYLILFSFWYTREIEPSYD